jgi:cyanophycinase-like exopeptidase
MVRFIFLFSILFCIISAKAQSYTSYFTGDTSDVTAPTSAVTVLMGGATEDDHAMTWFLQHSGGGDVVVLRTSGSDGYNNYMYSQLGVSINSVQTIVCNNASASNDHYVIQQLMNAEALWFAGGDQWTYVSYWNNTPIDTAINYLINVKKIPVGGTSAGMAILGQVVFTAQNGSATSSASLANPYVSNITLLKDDFVFIPWLKNVVTDTHYDNPDRRGRHMTFMARIMKDYSNSTMYGIACNEYVAVCIDTNGLTRVYGDYPNYQEFAYFLQANCIPPNDPEACLSGQPLNWNRNSQAVKVYKVPGTPTGTNYFQLSDWTNGYGGSWQNWYVLNGVLHMDPTTIVPNCNPATSIPQMNNDNLSIHLYPNPAVDEINIDLDRNFSIEIYDMYSKLVLKRENCSKQKINISGLRNGCYMVVIKSGDHFCHDKFLKF